MFDTLHPVWKMLKLSDVRPPPSCPPPPTLSRRAPLTRSGSRLHSPSRTHAQHMFIGAGAYPWDSITKREITSDSRVIPFALSHCEQASVNPNPARAMELLYTLLHDNDKPCCGGGGYDVEATRALVAPHAAMLLLAEKRTAPFALKKTAACCPNKFHDLEAPILALAELLPHPSLASPALFPTAALADAAQLAITKLGLHKEPYAVHFGEAVLNALALRIKAPAAVETAGSAKQVQV
jgi:hypothetical protein